MYDPKYLVSAEQLLQCGGINPAYKYNMYGSCVTQDYFRKQVVLKKKRWTVQHWCKMCICSRNILSLFALNVLLVIGSNLVGPLSKRKDWCPVYVGYADFIISFKSSVPTLVFPVLHKQHSKKKPVYATFYWSWDSEVCLACTSLLSLSFYDVFTDFAFFFFFF